MIRPPGSRGVVFTSAAEGDLRHDPVARRSTAERVGVAGDWATLHQVHGSLVRRASRPGPAGDGDALFTTVPGLPLAVFTADCLAVGLEGKEGVGIAHAGWRGLAAGVVHRLRDEMESAGISVRRAAVGPGIGPCCFEVGAEVVELFSDRVGKTRWGTPSVDLWSAAADQLEGLQVWRAEQCTFDDESYFSYRRDGTALRAAGIVWKP